jgi:hypothetical protein
VSQGWIVKLADLKKENNYLLRVDVLAPAGWPLGTLAVSGIHAYDQQSEPGLISSIEITTTRSNATTSNLAFELLAFQPTGERTGEGTSKEVAHAGRTYERTTTDGWRVRITVRALSINEHPKLHDGTTGVTPVFSDFDLNIEVGGKEATPYLGITADNVSRSRAATENLRGHDLQLLDHGVVIREVLPGSPADKASLRKGDVILALNDRQIDEYSPLSVLLGHYNAGESVRLNVVRDTELITVEVTLETHP